MTDTTHGHVANVAEEVRGDELVADLATFDSVLHVGDVTDFDETGGFLAIEGGEIRQYTEIDDASSTITLSAPWTGVTIPTGFRIMVVHAETQELITQWVADITDDVDGSSFQATVSHALVQALDGGVRGIAGESVVCTRDSSGEWWVTDLLASATSSQSPDQPQSHRTRNAVQSIPDNTWTSVNFNTQVAQTSVSWASNQWTVKREGTYEVAGYARFTAGGTTGRRGIRITKNGARFIEILVPPTSADTSLTISFPVRCAAGDTLAVEVFQNSGSAQDIAADCRGSVYLLG